MAPSTMGDSSQPDHGERCGEVPSHFSDLFLQWLAASLAQEWPPLDSCGHMPLRCFQLFDLQTQWDGGFAALSQTNRLQCFRQ